METSTNMDYSDDDVIFVETEVVEIEVITLSDDETNTSSTSFSTFSNAMIPRVPVNHIKKEINPAIVGSSTPPQYNTSPLQHFTQSSFGSQFRTLQKVKKSISQRSKKRNRGKKQIEKTVSTLEPNNISLKKLENKNKALLHQPKLNNIQTEKQTAYIPSSNLSRNNNLNVEPEDNGSHENSWDQSVDMVNQSQATRSDIEKTGSSCNLNVEPPITMEQDDLGNESIVNEARDGLSSDMGKTRSPCELNVESTATVEDNYLQDNSRSQNVVMMNKPQSGPTCTSNEAPAELIYNDGEMNKDENLPAQQPVTNNPSQVQQSNHTKQNHRDENPPAQQPVTNNTSQEQQDYSHSTQQHRDENLSAQQSATSNSFHLQKNSHSIIHPFFKNPSFSQSEYRDSLLSVIVEEGYPDVQQLTEHHLHILRRLVGFEIDNVLATNGNFVPRFQDSYVNNGVILVRSSDKKSQTWLQSIVPMLNPDPGVKLTIVSPRQLNQTYRVKICIFHESGTQKLILTRMQKQNPDINMGSWQLQSVHRLMMLNGTKTNLSMRLAAATAGTPWSGSILHMLIPAYSVKHLEKRKFKLHYGLYQVDVKMKDSYYKKKC